MTSTSHTPTPVAPLTPGASSAAESERSSGPLARLPLVLVWRALTVVAALAAVALFGVTRLQASHGAEAARVRHATLVWMLLAVVAVVSLLLPRRWFAAEGKGAASRSAGEAPWRFALLVTAGVAVLGGLAVGYIALNVPAVAASRYKAWDYLDKRWIAVAYLLLVGLPYVPALLYRMVRPAPASARRDVEADATRASRGGRRVVMRVLAVAIVGSVLALAYVAPLVRRTLVRPLDSHEMVHLGGLQAMSQGAKPFTEARTQYGPGWQLATYEIVQATELSVRGMRLSHLLLNLGAIAVFFAIVLYAYGWLVGGAVILLGLFMGPLQVSTMVGWGLLLRWLAPMAVGVLAPMVLWRTLTARARYALVATLGAACGVLAWMAQENGATSVMTMALVIGVAFAFGRVTLRTAVGLGVAFLAALLAGVLIPLTLQVGPSGLGAALALYRSGSGLVFAGYTDTPWSDVNTFLLQPIAGRGPAEHLFGWKLSHAFSGWSAAYFLTPYAIMLVSVLALYSLRSRDRLEGDVAMGKLLGIASAAAALDLLTLFRADSTHFAGMSFFVAPLIVLTVVYLPSRLFDDRRWQLVARASFVAAAFLVYPFLSTSTGFRFREALNPRATLDGLRAIREVRAGEGIAAHDTANVFVRRLGFVPDSSATCCRSNKLTFGQLGRAMRDVHTAAAGRTVYVDTRRNYSAVGPVASAVYFFADLRPGSSYLEPMMSLWTDSDIAALERELAARNPECLLTGGSDYAVTDAVLRRWGTYTTQHLPEAPATLYCRS